jgi:hypothetical protein
LFADDTSILLTPSDITKFNANTHTVYESINIWFKHYYLSLILKKTDCIKLYLVHTYALMILFYIKIWLMHCICLHHFMHRICLHHFMHCICLHHFMHCICLHHFIHTVTLLQGVLIHCVSRVNKMCRDVNIRLKSSVLYVT